MSKRLRRGDTAAFGAFCAQIEAPLYSYALRVVADQSEAEDIAQEALFRLYVALRDGRVNGAPRRYVFAVAHNLAMDWLRSQTGAGARALVEGCLDDEDQFKRTKAVSYLAGICSNQELEAVLDAYIRKGAYFYNVVCWLDRYLFAPEPLRSLYREKLMAE